MLTKCPSKETILMRMQKDQMENEAENKSKTTPKLEPKSEKISIYKRYQELARKCAAEHYSHWKYTQPITDSEGVTYRNWFCSQCFNIAKR